MRDLAAPEAGYTLVEILITATLTALLAGVAATTIGAGRQATTSTLTIMEADEQMRTTLDGLSRELRWASRIAEDTNNNNLLDPGEDTNANGRFEDDWQIATGSLTFNTRRTSGYSLPFTYRLTGSTLEKVVMMSPAGKQTVMVLARGVTVFTITDSNPGVTVNLGLAVQATDGTIATRSESIMVMPRN